MHIESFKMVTFERLISRRSSKAVATGCAIAIALLNLTNFVGGHTLASNANNNSDNNNDISQNLVRDPVEFGNPYHQLASSSSRITNPHGHGHDHVMKRIISSSNNNINSKPHRQTPSEGSAQSNGHSHDSSQESCPLCAAARKNVGLDEDTVRAVRVEMVKQQILKKLRLKEPPKMENVPVNHHTMLPPIALGNPVLNNAVRSEHEREQDDDVANIDLEDFYGKTEQIIVLPQDEVTDCGKWSGGVTGTSGIPINTNRGGGRGGGRGGVGTEAATCFIFNLPKEVRTNQISSAELWVYKLADVGAEEDTQININNGSENFHHFFISEVITLPNHRSSKRRSNIHFSSIASRSDIPESSSWINFNITERARKWLVTEEGHEHTVKISCSTCSRDVNEFPFYVAGEQQPFIVFNIANGKRKKRNRRSLNCSPGITECCRESLYISFEEIKWNWVLEPKGFDAYFCKGKCHGDTALAHTATRHSGIMIDYVKNQGGVNNKTIELVPCCTATEMSAISLIYRDPQSYNTTFQHVKLPNMVVQSCGCK